MVKNTGYARSALRTSNEGLDNIDASLIHPEEDR